jgi:riboflavin biosynthesis pyrimidine reductase
MRGVPSTIANPHDWRLYLELGAQADILLTTSRHLRAFAAERHQEIFDIGADEELSAWRIRERLGPHPAIAVLSEGLDIPIEAVRSRIQGQFLVITSQHAPPQKISALRSEGIDIVQLPSGTVLDARALATALFERGYERVYSVAGPRVTHALLSAGVIGRFYLTMVHLALGGRDFDTITLGDDLAPPSSFVLRELYFDSQLPTGAGQLFASLDFSAKPA